MLCLSFYLGGGGKTSHSKGLQAFTLAEGATHVAQSAKTSRAAFTLAEVLITLGIIGVVAAMTLPTLITNYEKKVTGTKAKKAYSELQNAIRISEAHNGEVREWQYPTVSSVENTRNFIETYIKPYFNDLKECSTGSGDRSCGATVSAYGVNYILPNGTSLAFQAVPRNMYVIVDVNGKQMPNALGTDAFFFETASGKLMPYGWVDNITKEDIKAASIVDYQNRPLSCKKQKGDNENELHRHGCTALLMLNNWEIDDDYPWK